MKHLLSSVAIAAVLAVASPVWAQAPTAPAPIIPPSSTSTTTTTTQPAISQDQTATPPKNAAVMQHPTQASAARAPGRHHVRHAMRGMRHHHMVRMTHHVRYAGHGYRGWHRHYAWRHGWTGGYGGGSPTDHVADQLNAQELGQGGSAGYGMGPPRPMMGGAYQPGYGMAPQPPMRGAYRPY